VTSCLDAFLGEIHKNLHGILIIFSAVNNEKKERREFCFLYVFKVNFLLSDNAKADSNWLKPNVDPYEKVVEKRTSTFFKKDTRI